MSPSWVTPNPRIQILSRPPLPKTNLLRKKLGICLHCSLPPFRLQPPPSPSIDACVINEWHLKSLEETFQIRNIAFFVLLNFTGTISGGFPSKQFIQMQGWKCIRNTLSWNRSVVGGRDSNFSGLCVAVDFFFVLSSYLSSFG